MKNCPNFGCGNTGSYMVQLSEDEVGQEQCQFCYCEPDSIFNVMANLRQLISDLKEDGERLAEKHSYYDVVSGAEFYFCVHCGGVSASEKEKMKHYPNGPITLHAALMEKIEKAGI